MKTADWVAIHRKHHAKVEAEHDPHSPAFGINKSFISRCGPLSYGKKQ